MELVKYEDIFLKAKESLRIYNKLTQEDFNARFDEFKHYGTKTFTDQEFYRTMVDIIFYSGFKAETISNKLDIIHSYFPDIDSVALYTNLDIHKILNDKKMIRNEKKINACVNNAIKFQEKIKEYGSFNNYLYSFNPDESFENLMLLRDDLKNFSFLGEVTSYHFLTDVGFPVLKPDRVIMRIFENIGLVTEGQFLQAVLHGRKFGEATKLPMRYIDIILVKYGQVGIEKPFNIEGICVENKLQCNYCGIREYCKKFYRDKKTCN